MYFPIFLKTSYPRPPPLRASFVVLDAVFKGPPRPGRGPCALATAESRLSPPRPKKQSGAGASAYIASTASPSHELLMSLVWVVNTVPRGGARGASERERYVQGGIVLRLRLAFLSHCPPDHFGK